MVNEEQIKKIIEETTGTIYTGKLNVDQDDGYYILRLYMDQDERPRITMAIETEDDQKFMDYIKEEMRVRKLNIVKFWRLDKLDS